MLESLGISAQVFKSFQNALERIAESVTERMIDREDIFVDSQAEEKEKEPLLTISSLRLLKGTNPTTLFPHCLIIRRYFQNLIISPQVPFECLNRCIELIVTIWMIIRWRLFENPFECL